MSETDHLNISEIKAEVDERSHPAARLFPVMDDERLRELAEDIKAHGQREAITVYDGMILDGRNRAAACKMLGIAPVTIQAAIDSPVSFVISMNLQRRHLNTSQRTAIAAEMAKLLEAEAHQRQIAHLKQFDGKNEQAAPVTWAIQKVGDFPLAPKGANGGGKVTSIAAKAFNVSTRGVERAKRVLDKDQELHAKVKAGKVKVNAAYEQVRESQRSVKELGTRKGRRRRRLPAWATPGEKKQPTGRDIMRANSHKERMSKSLGSVSGAVQGLMEVLDVSLIAAACTPAELRKWVREVKELASGLNNFAKKLEEEEKRKVAAVAAGTTLLPAPPAEKKRKGFLRRPQVIDIKVVSEGSNV